MGKILLNVNNKDFQTTSVDLALVSLLLSLNDCCADIVISWSFKPFIFVRKISKKITQQSNQQPWSTSTIDTLEKAGFGLLTWTYCPLFSSVSIVGFEHMNTYCVIFFHTIFSSFSHCKVPWKGFLPSFLTLEYFIRA